LAIKNVLLIDDEQDITEALKIGLGHHDFHVDTYNDPVEGVANYKEGKYDLVLLDIRMPKMNGFEAYQALREKDSNVKVCFLTAFEVYEKKFANVIPDSSKAHLLRKPISLRVLAENLDRFIGK
jgi:DNA-binding response OmpR family regulator